jgi:hypothetical protein
MTTVSEITPVVNLDNGYACRHSAAVHPIDAFLARVDEVMRSGRFRSESEWCQRAGVTRSYIAAIRNRGPGGTGEIKDVKREQVVKLAKTAGLDLSYLLGEDLRPKTLAAEGHELGSLEIAIGQFDWAKAPELTASQAEEVLDRARDEAGGRTTLPVGFWVARLAKIASEVHESHAAKSRVRKATAATK